MNIFLATGWALTSSIEKITFHILVTTVFCLLAIWMHNDKKGLILFFCPSRLTTRKLQVINFLTYKKDHISSRNFHRLRLIKLVTPPLHSSFAIKMIFQWKILTWYMSWNNINQTSFWVKCSVSHCLISFTTKNNVLN